MNVCVGELQTVCEVLLYASHCDPQLRGNTALVIGRLLRSGLGEGHGSWDGWLASLHPSTACSMLIIIIMSLPPPKKEVMFLVRSVCLSVCLSVCASDYSQTCERILTKFFGGVGHGSRTKWYNFGSNPDHASDPGVQSLKSGSSGSAEVCGL